MQAVIVGIISHEMMSKIINYKLLVPMVRVFKICYDDLQLEKQIDNW